jgi:nucleoside-diphosphate-sugar epimerase
VTGGTGFVGRRLIALAGQRALALSALARSPQAEAPGVDWVIGALDDHAALDRLCRGADAVIHVAAAVNARDRAAFAAANIAGTAAMVAAADRAGIDRFIHTSSLAAREPALSNYGWSKAEAEAVVRDRATGWTIVRPPAVYGPGDRETALLFRLAARGFVPLPPTGRLSLIHADDLASLLIALALSGAAPAAVIEADDGRPNGWSHREFADALGRAVGRRVWALPLPSWTIALGARVDELRGRLSGGLPRLSRDRARYLVHPDWTVTAAARPDAGYWSPAIETEAGLAATARWYRSQGWLP